MKRYKQIIVLAMLAVFSLGVVAAQAQDDGTIKDGRVNYEEPASSVAVYCNFVYSNADDPNMGILDSIDVLRIDADGQGNGILYADAATIALAEAELTSDYVLDSAEGYSLVHFADGHYSVITPLGYAFDWERGAINC
ncbi:MAG: hypothetical protein K8L99_27695 [Anaerolineae bacterium]|nr:hypothetical protein [Anaerolineae bacterium]